MATAGVASLKSPEAFRTISEVADMLDVPQHVLRFWETRFAHIKPIKRGGGRRFYRPEDVDLLRGIRLLLYFDGYTIKGVQKILREKGVRYTATLGREEAKKRGIATASNAVLSAPDRDEFDALVTLARVRDDAAETLALGTEGTIAMPDADDDRRKHLENLRAELLALKSRLAAARDRA